uniref:Putative LOC100575639 [Acyrthosiphon pisum] n=1 Tax=Lepeophtheirus salmonis TaxID=72036 RepID=A0A0K2TX31_LEPSM
MKEPIKNIRGIGKEKSLFPFQNEILISISPLEKIFEDLRESSGIKYILTLQLNQACFENFFSSLRALGVSNDHPTSVDCINRF